MIKGEKIRFDIHNILYSIYKFNKNLNSTSIKNLINKHSEKDISLLNNVTLNSMRYHLHTSKIINQYIKKKLQDHEKILLVSAITQIVFLDFKDYAVINCSVEIAKKLKMYHGLINASLKKIAKNKIGLKKTIIEFNDLPTWFKNQSDDFLDTNKIHFIDNFNQEPSIHIVFKSSDRLNNFEEKLIKTSPVSGFLINKKDLKKIKSFKEGDWWVQDFSSFFPIHNLPYENENKKFLDACAAPGGKTFQILSKKLNIISNDRSDSRLKILKSNLKRLNLHTEVLKKDFLLFKENKKYDFIILDAPCSSVGTIRRNPEIFFKTKSPNFKELNELQKKMLDKASLLLNKKGFILYMVCSFLKSETINQINKFLLRRDDFEIYKFTILERNKQYSKFVNKQFFITLPDTILNYKIDGYFAAYLRKK